MTKRANGDGSVYERQRDKKWVAAVVLGNGRRKTRTCATKAEARRALGELRRANDRGELVIAGKDTVSAFLDRWLDSRQGRVRASSLVSYRVALAHLRPLIGTRKLGALRTAHIQAAYTALQAATPPLAPATIRCLHAVLHHALERAVGWEELARNPCTGVELPRVERVEMQTYDAGQLARLFESITADREAALWRLMATTGLRRGEALGLRWTDYDRGRATLAVRRQLHAIAGGGLQLDAPLKTRASARTISVPASVGSALARWETAQKRERLEAGPVWQEHGLLFTRPDGRPMSPGWLSTMWRHACVAAGLPPIRLHDLRHTAATLALAQNVHPKFVMAMLGHSSITMTLDLYSHVLPEMQNLVAQAIERALIESPTQPMDWTDRVEAN